MRTLLLKFDNKIGVMAIFSYCIIGGLSATLSFGSFALLWHVLHIYYSIAITISYIITILFNFTCNRLFTFKSAGSDLIRHAYRYLAMILFNYAITMFIVHMTVERLHLSPYIGLLTSIAVTAVIGFTLSKFWVYTQYTANS